MQAVSEFASGTARAGHPAAATADAKLFAASNGPGRLAVSPLGILLHRALAVCAQEDGATVQAGMQPHESAG